MIRISHHHYRSLLLCAAFILFIPQCKALAQDNAAKINEVLSLAHKYGQFNGAALVAENGKVIYKNGFGMANMEWGIPNTSETKFRLGSITKQFTAMLTLQLVEGARSRSTGKYPITCPTTGKTSASG
jgi:CubicO group peptidase (beta-lactamase class C family)